MTPRYNMKIAVDLTMKTLGGVEQAALGLVCSLGRLQDGDEEFMLVARSPEHIESLRKYSGDNQRFVVKSPPVSGPNIQASLLQGAMRRIIARTAKPLVPVVRRILEAIMDRHTCTWPELTISDGFFESLGCDVIHFPFQEFVLSALPSIYNPHDLQHLHYPQFFTPRELAWRETVYRGGCQYAHTVVVGTEWVKNDIIQHYRLSATKIQVIPWAPPTDVYPEPSCEDVVRVRRTFNLTDPFCIFPAVTWPHKNHLRLFDALAYLRDHRNLRIRVVCTGTPHAKFGPNVQKRIKILGLEDQVSFLGFVSEKDLRCLYRLSQFLILPTLFEADSCPIFEAWREGVPVACSNVTALPDQVQDSALLFDPKDVQDIARALARMAMKADTRQMLIERGYRRVKDFDWDRTARAYRAVYRRAAGHPLTEEDRWLLQWDWMREPHRTMKTAQEVEARI